MLPFTSPAFRQRFVLWTLTIAACGVLYTVCDHENWDMRASLHMNCLILKQSALKNHGKGSSPSPPNPPPRVACVEDTGYCFTPRNVPYLTPRAFSDIVVFFGPAWVWIPLILHIRSVMNKISQDTSSSSSIMTSTLHQAAVTLRSIVAVCMFWYLSFVMFVRYTQKFDWLGGWDPSGHLFMYGLQLVPLWLVLLHSENPHKHQTSVTTTAAHDTATATSASPNNKVFLDSTWLRIAGIIEIVLFYMTITTSTFFHTPSEALAAWVLIATLSYVAYRAVDTVVANYLALHPSPASSIANNSKKQSDSHALSSSLSSSSSSSSAPSSPRPRAIGGSSSSGSSDNGSTTSSDDNQTVLSSAAATTASPLRLLHTWKWIVIAWWICTAIVGAFGSGVLIIGSSGNDSSDLIGGILTSITTTPGAKLFFKYITFDLIVLAVLSYVLDHPKRSDVLTTGKRK